MRSLLLFFTLQFFCVPLVQGGESHLNFQGMTGQLNIPTAMVLDKGYGEFLYSNLLEANRQLNIEQQYQDGVNLNLGVGLFDGLEVTMRDVGPAFDKGSDLSANIKWQLPWIPESWFELALGVQDVGGASNHYQTRYIVVSKQFSYLQLTAGRGNSFSDYGTLDGNFYGLELSPVSWLSLLAEHDAADNHYGIRVSTPEHWFSGAAQLSLLGMVSSSNDIVEENHYYGLSLSFPLGINQPKQVYRNQSLEKNKQVDESDRGEKKGSGEEGQFPVPHLQLDVDKGLAESAVPQVGKPSIKALPSGEFIPLRDDLVALGLENIKIGMRGREVIVVFENGVFNANSLDAVAVVIGELVTRAPADFEKYMVVMQRNDINVLAISGKIESYKAFLARKSTLPMDMTLIQSPDEDILADVKWLTHGGMRQRFVPRVTLSPEIESVVGSETGMFDYSLALNTQLEFPLAKGLSLNASYNTPVSNSDDYDHGIYQDRAKKAEWRETYISQAFVLPDNFTTQFMVGKTSYANEHYLFGQNELNLDIADGRYQLGLVMGQYIADEDKERWPVLVGTLRYYWDKADISFRLTAGNFLGQDVGYKLESRHHFGDTQIYLMYKDTDTKMVGAGFSIPLTPRKDMNPVNGFQLKGRPSWSYGLNTVIGEERNPVTFGVAVVPMQRNSLDARYYNFDRLSAAYFYRHSERLRDAYYRYHQ